MKLKRLRHLQLLSYVITNFAVMHKGTQIVYSEDSMFKSPRQYHVTVRLALDSECSVNVCQ